MTASYLPASVGGTELHVRQLIEQFRGDHQVRVLTRACDPEDEEYAVRRYTHEGIPVDTINNTFRDAEDFFFLYAVAGVDRAVGEVLDEFAPDLVHVHHLTCLSTNLLSALRRRGIPTVMTLHDYWMLCPRGQRIRADGGRCDQLDRVRCHQCIRDTWGFLFPDGEPNALTVRAEMEMLAAWDDHVQRALDGVDRLIVPDASYRDSFAARGLDPARIAVIPHGLDPLAFAEVAAQRQPGVKLRVGFLGTVIPSKGVHLLLEAVRGLGDRVSVDIYGGAPPYHEDDGYLERLEAAVPAGVEVRFHGRYEPQDAPRILSVLDVLAVPSIWEEAFGLTVREGFLAGIPVVASDLGALTSALANDRGLLFRPGDAADLRRCLVRLLDEPDLVERLRGRPAWVRSLDEMATDTLAVYAAARADAVAVTTDPDPVAETFRHDVARVQSMSRAALLDRAADGVAALADRLGLAPPAGHPLRTLARSSGKLRDEFRTRTSEVSWLRRERAEMNRTLAERDAWIGQARENHAREVDWLHRNNRDLAEAKAALEAEVKALSAENQQLKSLLDESVRHGEELGGHLRELEANQRETVEWARGLESHASAMDETARSMRALADEACATLRAREDLLARLARARLVRLAARIHHVTALREFES